MYADGERFDCTTVPDPPAEPCDRIGAFGASGLTFTHGDDGGDDAPSRVFVAVYGTRPSARLGTLARGWRLEEVPPTFSFVRGYEAEATGAQGGLAGGAEVFRSAAAAGGEDGSVAVGQPPCSDPLWQPGAGVTRLVGGETEPSHVCGADTGGVTDFAAEATTWRLDGAAAGALVSGDLTRLVVIDLPPPCDTDTDTDCDDA